MISGRLKRDVRLNPDGSVSSNGGELFLRGEYVSVKNEHADLIDRKGRPPKPFTVMDKQADPGKPARMREM